MSLKDKYLKYKNKYLELKKYIQTGGYFPAPQLLYPEKADQFNYLPFERFNEQKQLVRDNFPHIDVGDYRFIVLNKFILNDDPIRNILSVQSYKLQDINTIDYTIPPTLFLVYASASECNVWRYMTYTYDLLIEQESKINIIFM